MERWNCDFVIFSVLKLTFFECKIKWGFQPEEKILIYYEFIEKCLIKSKYGQEIELVSTELNHLAAILHVYAGGLIFMKKKSYYSNN